MLKILYNKNIKTNMDLREIKKVFDLIYKSEVKSLQPDQYIFIDKCK